MLSLPVLIIILLILLLVGVIPKWPHSEGWGYTPGGIIAVVLIVLLVLMLMGKI